MMRKKHISVLCAVLSLLMLLTCFPVLADSPENTQEDLFRVTEKVLPVQTGTTYSLHLWCKNEEVRNALMFSSSDPSIVSVSGEEPVPSVTALAPGSAEITISYDDGDSVFSKTLEVNSVSEISKCWKYADDHWFLCEGTPDTYLTGWQMVGDAWYYFDSDGQMMTGLTYINGRYYFLLDSGAMATGWVYASDTWYFFDASGAAHNGWLLYNNHWYFCGIDGGILTGWQTIDGKTYFLDLVTGAMKTGWLFEGADWFLMSSSGARLDGWQYTGGWWYYLDPAQAGSMQTGWLNLNGKTYYLAPNGAMCTGWQLIEDCWYYFAPSGAMCTGWQYINGYWYYFSSEGKMYTGWLKEGGIWYYLLDSGRMAAESAVADGKPEVFQTNGAWVNTGAMDALAQNYTSNTNFLILVSLKDKATKIYTGSYGNWVCTKAFLCTVGDSANGSATVTGDFYVGYSSWGNPYTRGYSFDDTDGHTLYYWTRFCDAYLFHSQLYDGGTYNLTPYGNALGQELSHGCVRLRVENAKWIYDNVPDYSRVIVY